MSTPKSLHSGVLHALLLVAVSFLPGCDGTAPAYEQGYVEGEYVYVASSVAGDLRKLHVHSGQSVTAGTVLFELDDEPEALKVKELGERLAQARARVDDISKGSRPSELAVLEARLESAKAALALAEREYERRRKPFAAGETDVVSAEELDRFEADVTIKRLEQASIEAQLATARLGGRADAIVAAQKEQSAASAALAQSNWQLAEKKVAAPLSGLVQDTLFREGEFVPATRPVISLLPPGNVKIRFFVPQATLPILRVNAPIRVQLDGMDAPINARISYISSTAEFTPPVIYSKESRSKLVFMVEAAPEARAVAQLRPGQPLEVYLD